MSDVYHAFLIRCWCRDGRATRLTVEHIGTGRRVLVTSPVAVLAWLERWCSERPHAAAAPDDLPPAPQREPR